MDKRIPVTVFIGQDIAKGKIIKELQDCLCTNKEYEKFL